MENDYLVNEFLDGTLDAAGEERFFSMLSSESDIRNELKQQLAIKNAIKSDVRAFTPKAESTLQIFDKLGLIMPVVPTAIPTPTPSAFGSFSSLMKVGAGYLLAGALSSIVTAVAIFMIYDFGNDSTNETTKISTNKFVENSKSGFANSVIPKTDSYSESENANPIEPKVIFKYIYVNEDRNSSNKEESLLDNNTEKVADDNNNYNDISHSDISVLNSSIADFSDKSQVYLSNNLPNLSPFNLYNDFITDDGKLLLEVRGSDYIGNNIQGITPSNNLSFINSSFSISYKLNSEFSMGIDYRRERFAQEFTGKEGTNYFVYKQEPNFQTISAFAKYNPEFLRYEIFSPFALMSLGANTSGPVGRIMLGTDLQLSNNFYFTFGLDYNTLFYTQSGANFLSSKVGYHFGAGIRL